jgi:hypothetical protein
LADLHGFLKKLIKQAVSAVKNVKGYARQEQLLSAMKIKRL